ncbi:deoxyribose-phosphate aldolase [Arthrobacter livingstonensis]|uniref:Deoxyribose-phosphate aldolase n=1 Tax=Arthrobacter livingstonensis TaxID=670078 RepID=A0A2V5LMW3_9MICC|nr:deoxyribose-phosphate aldolase [Arthrobacter livingstonensis]PYI69090.1 deoxyribose-phosphate aldolase [Arthrobacter livingstonensis]
MTKLTPELLAKMVDHTFLQSTGTQADAEAAAADAARLGTYSVCVSPSMLPLATTTARIAAVCGFPSGKHHSSIKAAEAEAAVQDGADEIDMVIDVGAALSGDFEDVRLDIAAVREAVPGPIVLKVILETAALTDEQIVRCCEIAESCGADFVKTSTGFHPAGGATVHAVELMARTVGPRVGVKASGGIRDWAAAQAMIDAGATRLGLSGTEAVLEGGTATGY